MYEREKKRGRIDNKTTSASTRGSGERERGEEGGEVGGDTLISVKDWRGVHSISSVSGYRWPARSSSKLLSTASLHGKEPELAKNWNALVNGQWPHICRKKAVLSMVYLLNDLSYPLTKNLKYYVWINSKRKSINNVFRYIMSSMSPSLFSNANFKKISRH